jgi:hypothetical protein
VRGGIASQPIASKNEAYQKHYLINPDNEQNPNNGLLVLNTQGLSAWDEAGSGGSTPNLPARVCVELDAGLLLL